MKKQYFKFVNYINCFVLCFVLMCTLSLTVNAQIKDGKKDTLIQTGNSDALAYDIYRVTYKSTRIGGTTGNKDGALFYSNPGYNLYFAPDQKDDDWYDYYFAMKKGRNGDPTFYSVKNNLFRIGSPRGIGFWGSNKQETDDLPDLLIHPNGNVGVGSNDPDSKLEIVTGDNSWGMSIKSPTIAVGSYLSKTNGVAMYGTRTNHGLELITNDKAHLTVTSGGNVGVDLGDPSTKFQVYTADDNWGITHKSPTVTLGTYLSKTAGMFGTKSNNNLMLFANNSNNPQLVVTPAGKIGIGTSSPLYKLEVQNDSWGIVHTSGDIKLGSWIGNNAGEFGTISNNDMVLFTNDKDVVRITKDGKFGIGTSTPTSKFHVYGNSLFSDTKGDIISISQGRNDDPSLYFPRDGFARLRAKGFFTVFTGDRGGNDDNPDFSIDKSGNAGFGVVNPNAKLHVKEGNILMEKSGVKVSIDKISKLDAGWLGTASDHGLFLGTNNEATNIYLDKNENTYIGFGSSNLPSDEVSAWDKSKYDLFVSKGLLSESIALGPKETWSDHVFLNNHKLLSLSQVDSYVKQYSHLPNIPSAKEIAEKGYVIHDMNVKFLEKIEELTLYAIDQEKKRIEQDQKIKDLESKILQLQKLADKVDRLEKMITHN